MNAALQWLFGRLPIGWLRLSHNRGRMAAAVAGVTFANVHVFMQLGILGALNTSIQKPYGLFRADAVLSANDAKTLTDGSDIARVRMVQALAVPGVAGGMPLYTATKELKLPDGSSATLMVYGLTEAMDRFAAPDIAAARTRLLRENTVLIDGMARGLPDDAFQDVASGAERQFEMDGTTVTAVGLLQVGGGFSADGTMIASDQTFLRLFPRRNAGAPDRILLQFDEGVSHAVVLNRLQAALPETVHVHGWAEAAQADQRYQTQERPTGIIFGFGVLIGILVGVVIVYQVLATDVADHLREYATFKAMGYPHRFFLGIVFEEALVLAVLGFIPGFVLALMMYAALNTMTSLPVEMEAARAIAVFVGTILACSVSGALATRRLAQADPAELF